MMYADDHQLYSAGKNVNEVQSTLNEEGKSISGWYQNNQLQGNLKKYQVLNIGSKQQRDKVLDVTMMNTCIKQDEVMKILGVSIDENLDFSHHVSTVCKSAAKRVGVLTRLRNMLPTQAKLKIYKTAILPILTYCHTVWHHCKASDGRKLERVQERALRTVYCNRTSDYETLLKWANLSTLFNRRLQDIAILMFKVKHG